ncbi:phage tail tape measure protein [uncultured Oscillibacter sp.]|uniref:phage tail tape measure protein n=1 Tax=uncultured Oscillibacter sp. TaxID=876091 RepID=UPI0026E2DAD3|nr:phage tail tape measure protein [uncultured Oscillibacter sp.]
MAAETYRIEIPVVVEDQTDPGASNATKKVNAFDKVVQQAKDRLDKMNRTKFQVALEAIDKVSAVVGTITGAVRGLAGKAWRVTMSVIDKATAPLRGIINILKNPILQAGAILGISVGLKDTIDTYSSFEATMSQVKSISGATAEQMMDLNAKAKEMGATTKFTASEAGEAFTYMAMAGWKTGDMLNGIEGIMSLAAASGESLATTSDIVTDALTAFGMTAKDSGRFADVLAVASSNANTNVSMMGETFKYVGAASGALGYSIEDVALGIGLMANAGIKASQAGTELNSIFTRLGTNTNGARDAIEDLGISFYKSDGSARAYGDVLKELRAATKNMTQEQKINFANTVAGQRAQAGLLAMLNATEEDYNKLTEAIENCDGAAAAMADTMLDNLAGDMTLLQSAVEGVKISIGERLSPYLRQFVQFITSKMPDVEKAAGKALDFIEGKVKWLKDTIADFTSGEDWANADIWGKLKIAWDKIVAEPFSEWWNGSGKAKITGMMGDLGRTIGSGITAGLLALLGIDTGGAISDGKAIGGAFIDGFMDGFDTEQITTALKNWAGEHKGTVAALGIVLGGKLIGGVAKGVQQARGLVSTIQGILGKGSGAGGMAGAMGSSYATTSMRVTAGVVNVYGNMASNAANAAGAAGRSAMGGLPALPGGGGTPPALPGGTGGAAAAGGLTSASGWLGRLLQVGSKSSVVGADGTLLAVNGGIGGTLGSVGGALGSGATTAAGAAAAGTAAIGGGLLGGAGIISGLIDIFHGTKTSGKEAQTAYATGGSKIGMVGAGAAAGAAIGSVVPVVGTGVGALVGAGIGGLGALGFGDKIGQALSDALDEGGWLNNMGVAISGFFTETLPTKWGEFWDGVGNFFTETVPYALGFAAGKVTTFFTETLPTKWGEFWTGVGNFFTESIPAWWETVKAGAINFFTVTIPQKWTEFWDGIGVFFTETIPAWWEDVKAGAVTFFTETLPTKWTEFWTGVGNFFTETIPAWIDSSLTSAKTFFTETLPEKWNSFWGGIGEKISGFFGGLWDTVSGAFSSGYSDATAPTPHAWGGIMTKPHMGIVAEAGAESIIPLSPSKRNRGIDLWEQTGQALGVRPYAEGGIVGETEDTEVPITPSGTGGVPAKVEVHLELSPQFVIEARESGMDENTIIAIIKAHIKEMVDDISDELAERLARVFANMPVRGGT